MVERTRATSESRSRHQLRPLAQLDVELGGAVPAAGFGRNRTRRVALVVSRWIEGKVARLQASTAPTTVFELLLGQSPLTCIEKSRLVMWVEALDILADQSRHATLIEVVNDLAL